MSLNLKKNAALMAESVEIFPWNDSYAYAFYLAQTYYYVSHSTRLLALSAGLMKVQDTPFHRRFLEHAAEEKGHEMMLLNDIKNLGFDISQFEELPETRMFWEPQYYKVQHKDPLALMGYIISLEAAAGDFCPKIKKKLEKIYSESTYTFIKVHGDDDPDHVEKAGQVIAMLPPERQKCIEENFNQSVAGFRMMITAIMNKLKEKKSVQAA